MAKAEYYGRCQACDRLQKFPKRGIANHGYQIVDRGQSGFFSGVCRGSHYPAYERDCSFIKEILLPAAKVEEKRLVAFIGELRKAPTEPRAYHHCYGRFGGYWKEVNILGAPHGSPHLELPNIDSEGFKIDPVYRYTWLSCKSGVELENLLLVAAKMNEYFAKDVERNNLRRIRGYIKWQEKRVEDWKPGIPLIPVDAAKELKKQFDKAFIAREIKFVEAV